MIPTKIYSVTENDNNLIIELLNLQYYQNQILLCSIKPTNNVNTDMKVAIINDINSNQPMIRHPVSSSKQQRKLFTFSISSVDTYFLVLYWKFVFLFWVTKNRIKNHQKICC